MLHCTALLLSTPVTYTTHYTTSFYLSIYLFPYVLIPNFTCHLLPHDQPTSQSNVGPLAGMSLDAYKSGLDFMAASLGGMKGRLTAGGGGGTRAVSSRGRVAAGEGVEERRKRQRQAVNGRVHGERRNEGG